MKTNLNIAQQVGQAGQAFKIGMVDAISMFIS